MKEEGGEEEDAEEEEYGWSVVLRDRGRSLDVLWLLLSCPSMVSALLFQVLVAVASLAVVGDGERGEEGRGE